MTAPVTTARPDGTATIEVNRPLLTGGLVMLGVGCLLCMGGGIAVTVAAVTATRSWVRQWDEPPSAMARRRYAQARSAAVAGAQGWRQNGPSAREVSAGGTGR
jgi:hypothetical protein